MIRKGLLGRQYLHRGIVFIFFLLMLADLASPQNCGEDVWGLLKAGSSQASVQASTVFGSEAFFISADIQKQQSSSDSDSAPAEDDCFCCCSHILPGAIFHVDEPSFAPSVSEPAVTALPIAPSQSAFHPPRLS
jgi:hypothetical protein